MTLRTETDATGEPVKFWIDGIAYTPDELRNHIARSHALTTVARWLDQELRTTRRQRRTIRVLCHVVRRLSNDLHAPWLVRNSPTAQRRLGESGSYALERAASTKER